MAPQCITKHILPCSGTPVHKLTCSHTIHASFLHPTTSSKCAPNCAAVGLSTTAEPSFLCPTCYESTLRDEYQEFVDRCKKQAKEAGCNAEIIVCGIKKDYEHGTMTEKGWGKEVHTWCTVFMKHTSFEKVVREHYRWRVEMERKRGCKAVDGEFEEEVEVCG